MLSNDEEAWDDLDIKDNSFMYHTSRGIYSYYPDKDLSRACQSVSHPSFFDDDDTISTITSLHSDRFSVDDHDYSLSDNDDALGDGLTPYPTMKQQRHLRHPASSYSRPSSTTADFTDLLKGYEGPGTITRLERGGNRVHVDRGDWSQDLDLSATSLKLASMDLKRNSANQQYKKTMDDPFADFEDDTDDTSFFTGRSETSSFQKQVRFNSSLQPPPTTTTASNWKEEDDDEGFDDLDIPDRLSLKPYQPTTAPKSSPCAMPPALQKRLEQHIEKDDDDFLDGLDIKDAFKATPQPPPVKKGESKLPRLKQPRQPILFPSPSTSSRRKPGFENRLDRLTAPTYASRQRGRPEPSTTKPQPRQPKRIGTPAFVRTSDGSSLMARPRTSNHINYGNGSELDHLDDLAVWKRPSMARPSLKPPMSLGLKPKKPEPEKPWRCNMSKRKMTLIKPDEQKLAKEINDMRYDEREKRWHGNEQVTRTFDGTKRRRPGLIKNMMRATKSSSAAMVVGDMVFDQQKMTWNTCNGEADYSLAHIDDLIPSATPPPPAVVNDPLPLEMQRQMIDQELEHHAFFELWPMRDECAMTRSPLGHPVPQNTYILY